MTDNKAKTKEKILIVDDEVISVSDLESRLKALGYMVCAKATSGKQALELVEQHKPDLVMIDIALRGEMDGIGIAKVIWANWETAIIFLTSHDDSVRLLHAKPTYPFGYLLKPFQDQVFEITIEMTLHLVKVNAEREKAEKELQLTLDATTDGIWSWNFNTNELNFSPKYYKMLNYEPDEFQATYENWVNLIHPDDLDSALAVASEYLKTKPDYYNNEFRLITKGGEFLWVSSRAKVVERDRDGEVVRIIGHHQNIADRKKMELELRERSRFKKSLMNAIPVPIFYKDNLGRYLGCNKEYEVFFGKCESEIVGKSVFDTNPTQLANVYYMQDAEIFNSGETQRYESQVQTNNGMLRDVVFHKAPFFNDRNEIQGLIGAILDITERKQTEEALLASEEKFRNVANNVPGLVLRYKLNPDGSDELLHISKGVEDLYEISREDAVNNVGLLWDCIHKDDLEGYVASINESAENQSFWEREHRIMLPDGRVKWIHGRGVPSKQADGSTIWDTLEIDITEQKLDLDRQRIDQARIEALYMLTQMDDPTDQEVTDFALEEAVRFTNSTGGYLHFLKDDQVNLELFSWSSDVKALCRANPHPHYPLAQAGVWADCVRRREPVIHNNYSSLTEKRGLPAGHFPVYRHMSVPIFDSEKIVAVVGVGNKKEPYDNYDVKQLYLFMDSMWKILRKKRTTQELIQAREMAEIASKTKSEFLANMSHEIRTPLTGLIGMLDLLNETRLTDEQQKYIEIAVTSSKGLLTVINDILDFSKIEAGKMELVEGSFDLDELFDATRGMFQNLANQKGLNLYISRATDVPRRLIADSGRLRQILFNLVGNAVKFTQTGQITVEASSSRISEDKAWIDFAVSDTGVGIPQNQIENIFDSFTQVDGSSAREYQGSGLGLSIVKRLLDLMGGRIEVQSQVGQGTTFRFYLELKIPVQETHVAIEKPHRGPLEELRILVVEDNPVNRLLAAKLLEKMGHQLVTAENGREALSKLAEEGPFDLVFMDVQMPLIDGLEATRRIRSDTSGTFDSQIPIIALTAHAMKGDKESFLEAGMNDYIAKPIDKEELFSVIYRVINCSIKE